MNFPAGARLGPYEILTPIGAGGMGEVYRARDTRLNRDVALKVLLERFARDAERMARFEREAQLLASLNHPNIASLYGLEESGGVRALVMELVEGPSLAERIAAGSIPIEEALPIARQIAEALEYAHERGVIHRDLKPANVKITTEGVVKLLDFGLAKALDDQPDAGDPLLSPTLSLGATRAGVILGTAAYMSPEQARGTLADRRADVWAFGAVLYEMLAGRPVFGGESVSDILAAVLKTAPDWSKLSESTPAEIRKLLRRCLARDRKQRLQAIGEARIAIEEILAGAPPEPAAARPAASPATVRRFLWPSLAAALLAVAAAVSWVHFREAAPPEPVLRYSIDPPARSSVRTFAISPDGRVLAMAIEVEGKSSLAVRPLYSLQTRLLPGTDGAQFPFWSPDSRYVGFFADGKLKKIAAGAPSGPGPAQTLCNARQGRGGTWSREGVILFASSETRTLQRVSATGGVPSTVTSAGSAVHRFPVFLPDGLRFLYTAAGGPEEHNGIHLGSLEALSSRRLVADPSSASYVRPPPGRRHGHLLFVRESTLMAQPVDAGSFQPAGELFPVAEQIPTAFIGGFAPVSISDIGVLVYDSTLRSRSFDFLWFDRSGKQLAVVGAPALGIEVALSPDGTKAAVVVGTFLSSDIWVHDLTRGASSRLTVDPASEYRPVWSPDASRIAFTSNRSSAGDLYQKDSAGAGQDTLLLQTPDQEHITDWSRDGRFLVYQASNLKSRWDLWVLPLEGAPSDHKPFPFLATQFNESQGQFSPGLERGAPSGPRWMAYTSDESGRSEVYVRPFPPAGSGKWPISTGGGEAPRWRRDGKELFYLTLDGKLMAVEVKTGASLAPDAPPAFQAGTPQLLFQSRVSQLHATLNFRYDVAADGKRFLLVCSGAEAAASPLTVVVNWLAALNK